MSLKTNFLNDKFVPASATAILDPEEDGGASYRMFELDVSMAIYDSDSLSLQ